MLFALALLLAWIPAVIGWGSLFVLVRKLLRVENPFQYDVLEPILGLVILTSLTNTINFLRPVQGEFALLVLAVGWLLFVLRAGQFKDLVGQPLWIWLGLVWIVAIAFASTLPIGNFDSGLYHLSAMRWLIDEKTPWGLANLHPRLAYNSSWFSISALLAQTTAPYTTLFTPLASELLVTLFGLLTLSGIKQVFTHTELPKLSTILMIAIGAASCSQLVLDNTTSPSSDHPVMLLMLVLVFLMVRAVEQESVADFIYQNLLVLVLALYVVTVKLSMLPLLLFSVILFFYGLRRWGAFSFPPMAALSGVLFLSDSRFRFKLAIPPLAPLAAVASAAVVGPWLLREYMLSGCLLFPVSSFCFYNLAWTLPRDRVESEAAWIQSWARWPFHPPSEVLASWKWLEPWSAYFFQRPDILIPFGILIVGLIAILIARRHFQALPGKSLILGLLAGLGVGIGYWFMTAPDVRFGASWFWAIGLTVIGVGLFGLNYLLRTAAPFKIAAVLLAILMVTSVSNTVTNYANREKFSFSQLLFMVHELPEAKIKTQVTKQGVSFQIVDDALCWWQSTFCTPYFFDNLYVGRGASNRLFIHPGGPP